MEQFRVTYRDRSIEIFQADRLVEGGGEVRLLDDEGREVASWGEEEVHSIQKVEPDGGRAGR